MFFSADLANLILYCAQQLGVTLAVGAETIMLAAYLISMRDGVVDEKETQYAHAIKRVMLWALGLIIISGLGITALHAIAGESAVIFTPAFLFKWVLILLAVGLTLLRHKFATSSIVEGVIGATWYALFVVHILAPVTSWLNLVLLYGVWLIGFVLCWQAVVQMRKDKKGSIKNVIPAIIKKEEPKKIEPNPVAPPVPVTPPTPVVVAVPAPKPTIVLAPDLPKAAPVPPPAAPPTPPIAPAAPKPEKITLTQTAPNPFDSIEPSPGVKVTDTPFLPKVPPLQPIPTMPGTPPAAPVILAVPPVPPASPASAPLTTTPGGTSTPTTPASDVALVQEGLSAMNVMPKAPTK